MSAPKSLPDSSFHRKVITRRSDQFWRDAVERYEKRGPVFALLASNAAFLENEAYDDECQKAKKGEAES
jgi:hypothetical protein